MLTNNHNSFDNQEYLYDMLDKIKQNPAIFLGKIALTRLRSFLDGYMGARADLGLPETQQETEFNQFQDWIQSRFKITSSQSWDSIILFYSEDERDGLNNFFRLFYEFKTEKINQKEEINYQLYQTAKVGDLI
jgi:hypothetical protein